MPAREGEDHAGRAKAGPAFLTGGTGFLGRALVAALRQRGHDVRVLVRPGREDSAAAVAKLGAVPVAADLLDPEGLRRAMGEATLVFHLAGRLLRPGVPEAAYRAVHVKGTSSVLQAAQALPALRAVVHCSTTGVLGTTGDEPADEARPPRPTNIYERTKAEAEGLALEAAARGLPVVVARPSLVYGPGDLHLLGWFRAIQRGHYRVVGRGDSRLHPVYIDDLTDGLLRCAEHEGGAGRVYHLVGEGALSIRELAQAIAAAVGRRLRRWHLPHALAWGAAALLESLPGIPPERLPLTRQRVAFMSESRAYCGCRARDELGFAPRVPLPEGLRRTVAWYRQEGHL